MYELNAKLYNFIYKELGAFYQQMNQDKIHNNVDNSEYENKQYLGTYFPDSYKESYIIFKDIFNFINSHNVSTKIDNLEILDFGSGTGAEVFGFLQAINDCINEQNITITIHSVEGNQSAVEIQKQIYYHFNFNHIINVKMYTIKFNNSDEIFDFINKTFKDNFFDIIMSFKSLCEFLYIDNLIYLKFLDNIQHKLKKNGLYVLVDVACEYRVKANDGFCNEYVPIIINQNIREYYKNNNHSLNIIIPFCCFLNKVNCSKDKCYTKTQLYVKFIKNFNKGYIQLDNKLDIFHYNLFIKDGSINNLLHNTFSKNNNIICKCNNRYFNICYCNYNIKFTKYFCNNFFATSQFTLEKYKDYI